MLINVSLRLVHVAFVGASTRIGVRVRVGKLASSLSSSTRFGPRSYGHPTTHSSTWGTILRLLVRD